VVSESFQQIIDRYVENASPSSIAKAREELTQIYKKRIFTQSIFADEAKRIAYLATRFPATYSAVSKVLSELKRKIPTFSCKKLLDLGAGPATAACASLDFFSELEEILLIEKCPFAIKLGKEFLPNANWMHQNLESAKTFPHADLAIASYSLGELKKPLDCIEKLWKSKIDHIIIIEPGTPSGYRLILDVRDWLLQKGAHLIAPCPHAKKCPLTSDDWCHFSVRLERTKLHRYLKKGKLGFEDEKFSYLAVSRKPEAIPDGSRILRHPQKGSGHVRLALCTEEGEFKEEVVSKRQGKAYKSAKEVKWGDVWSALN